eukprot:scaffold19514_cov103-Isochrysis_galbana.AAC.3
MIRYLSSHAYSAPLATAKPDLALAPGVSYPCRDVSDAPVRQATRQALHDSAVCDDSTFDTMVAAGASITARPGRTFTRGAETPHQWPDVQVLFDCCSKDTRCCSGARGSGDTARATREKGVGCATPQRTAEIASAARLVPDLRRGAWRFGDRSQI